LSGRGPALALAAAALFGLSAPAAKVLLGVVDPWLLAGFLYLGSGIGLTVVLAGRRLLGMHVREAALRSRDLPWLAGAIAAGGVVGPVLLMFGLARGRVSQAALLLNLEGVFTALVAWIVVGEHVHRRIVVGMLAITAGAVTLTLGGTGPAALDWSALLIAGACVAWAIDNNLTRAVSGSDPLQIAALKGAAAGTVNVVAALALGASWPSATTTIGAGAVGLLGYGTSLALFVLALRQLGTARTGAYFSTAPFIGALAAVVALGEPVTVPLLVGGILMAIGVWLHLSEQHEHEHGHTPLMHEHAHRHDEHHQHDHAPGTVVTEPHTHPHLHAPLRHGHAHYPDLHHRHDHPGTTM
jgi:drug/metabolite transporter (DMT)-like permease